MPCDRASKTKQSTLFMREFKKMEVDREIPEYPPTKQYFAKSKTTKKKKKHSK